MIGQIAGILALLGMLMLPLVVLTAVTWAGQWPCPTGRHHHYRAGVR